MSIRPHQRAIALAVLVVAAMAVVSPVFAGTRTGGANFAWNAFLERLQSNFVTTIAGFFAVVALIGAAMAHRSGDSEATIKRVILALFLGGIALGAEVLVDDIASDFGAILPPGAM
jgi:type IV secretory pathway VirB2 component (pilin)